LADMEKYNTATLLGWRVLRCTPRQINKQTTRVMQLLEDAIWKAPT
jgi:very-short-patch-repair endonuclease